MRCLPALLCVGACSINGPGDLAPVRQALWCDVQVACFDAYPDRAACEKALGPPETPDCADFDLLAARDCATALRDQAARCPFPDAASWQMPTSCALVCANPAVPAEG